MKRYRLLIILLITITLFSCEKDQDEIIPELVPYPMIKENAYWIYNSSQALKQN